MMKRSIAFYEKLLFGYLMGYALLHIGIFAFLALFERGWSGFAYLWIFGPHLPVFLVAVGLSFVGKKTQRSSAWLVALILFAFSNGWWVYGGLQGSAYWTYFLLIALTVIPIFATTKLMLLTKTELSVNPKA